MSYFKDGCVCIVLSIALLFFSDLFASKFLTAFMDSVLEVVCGIFAINIASSALIADLIHKVSVRTGHSFADTKQSLVTELKIQAGLIFATVLLMVFYYANYSEIEISFIKNNQYKIHYCVKIAILSTFIYFVWLTYDLGRSLYEILNESASKKDGEE